jgi:hypothetical protein
MHESTNIAAVVISRLAPHLGPNVARMAMKTSSQKALGLAPEATQLTHVPKLLDAIRPMLNVMLGKDHAETIILEIRRDLAA